MNEFGAKKLGEVLAFEYLGKETFERGINALSLLLGKEYVNNFISTYSDFISNIEEIANEEKALEITLPKKDKTLTKLKNMQELYVGDEWDNAIELSEWSGFYEGAAIVHYELVLGVSKKIKNKRLENIALKAIKFHSDSLKVFSNKLNENGKNKA